MKQKDIPIIKSSTARKNLEDYEPGASREEVLKLIEKVASSPKPSRKRIEPPVSTS